MTDFAKRFDRASAELFDILDDARTVDADAASEAEEILDEMLQVADDPFGDIMAILEDIDKGRKDE